MKNCGSWEELMLEKLMEGCLLWDEPHAGAGESVRSPAPEEEGRAEITPDATPFPDPLCCCGGGGRENR